MQATKLPPTVIHYRTKTSQLGMVQLPHVFLVKGAAQQTLRLFWKRKMLENSRVLVLALCPLYYLYCLL
jgi:hypothetical protein